jgi:predicted O-methyltransferase YrrM
MLEKLKTLAWFGKRPDHWAHALALGVRKFRRDMDSSATKAKATQWAAQSAVSLAQVVEALGWDPPEALGDLIGHDVLEAANQRTVASGANMGGAGDMTLLYLAAEASSATRAVETGVAFGWSSLALLSSIAKRNGRLVSVDMEYPKRDIAFAVGTAVPSELRSHWQLIRKPDRPGLTEAIDSLGGEIDLCHYDSDKTYYGRMWAYPKLWSALRPGGIFISDDIHDNFAFKEFLDANEVAFHVIESQGKYVGITLKPASREVQPSGFQP